MARVGADGAEENESSPVVAHEDFEEALMRLRAGSLGGASALDGRSATLGP